MPHDEYRGRDINVSNAIRRGIIPPWWRTKYRILVKNISSRTSWPELKYYFRQCGHVKFALVYPREREGLVVFGNRGAMECALDRLDGAEMNGRRISLVEVLYLEEEDQAEFYGNQRPVKSEWGRDEENNFVKREPGVIRKRNSNRRRNRRRWWNNNRRTRDEDDPERRRQFKDEEAAAARIERFKRERSSSPQPGPAPKRRVHVKSEEQLRGSHRFKREPEEQERRSRSPHTGAYEQERGSRGAYEVKRELLERRWHSPWV